jgi:type IV secretory pathway TraG/TraD family ATPase VirD4
VNRSDAFAAFRPFRLALSERIARLGWDHRPHPSHVVEPAIPSFPGMRLLRFIFVAAVVFTLLSAIPSGPIARSTPGIATPVLGFYTWLDLLPRVGINALDAALPSHQTAVDTSWSVAYIVWLAVFGIIGLFVGALTFAIPTTIPRHLRGTVRDDKWCSLNDLVDAKLLGHNEPGIVVGAVVPPPLFGVVKRKPMLLVDSNPAHVLMKSHSRGGKDVGPIAFTLATNPYSAIVTDNKNEQYQLVSGLSRDYYGKNVYRLCLQSGARGEKIRLPNGEIYEEAFGTSKHNVLKDEIPWGTDLEYPSLFQVMTVMVAKKASQLDDGENGHWYRTSRVIGAALGYKVVYDPEETLKSLSRVAMLLAGDDNQTEESRELKKQLATDGAEVDSIHDIIEQYLGFSATGQGSRPKWLLRALDSQRQKTEAIIAHRRRDIGNNLTEKEFGAFERSERSRLAQNLERIQNAMVHPDMERAIRNTMRIRGEEAASVYSTINAVMTPWLDPLVIENTRESTFRIMGLNNDERPSVLFLVNPPNYGDMYQPCYRVFLEIALRLQVPLMQQDNVTKRMSSPHKWPMTWIINEPMTIGEIPALVPILPFAASYSHRFFFGYQLANQIEEQFGKNEPLSGNSMTTIYHSPTDPQEQEAVAKMCGERMVVKLDESRSGFQAPSQSLRADTIPMMTGPQVASMPSDPTFRMTWDVKTGKKVPKLNPDGSLHVLKQAEQILSTRRGYAYTRKIQWFTDEFPGVFRLIKKYAPAIPSAVPVAPVPITPNRAKPVETKERPVPEITLVPKTAPRRYRPVAIATAKPNGIRTGEVPAGFKDMLK